MTWIGSATWLYVKSEAQLYTVGFFDPDGNWHPDSDYPSREEAVSRVRWLNGFKEEE